MRALVYGAPGDVASRAPAPGLDPELVARLAAQPVRLVELDDPVADADHAVVEPSLVGVCGSDVRLLLGDFTEGDLDNPMAAFSQLPFVLGHEAVGVVRDPGGCEELSAGQRVVLDPWLSCAPRGFEPCDACRRGELAQCERFLDGPLGPGLHVGVAGGVPGAFATRLRAHASQLHPVPEGVTDAAAVLADPFSVSLHAIVRTPPPPGGRALVCGAGSLGTMAVAVLRRLHPDVRVAVLCRYPHQREVALSLGAELAVDHEPRDAALDELASWSCATLRPALSGLPMAYPGGVDVVYDTVASADTLELAVRIATMRGRVVLLGVATPRRFEWTPVYFKELDVRGSSGFGVEEVAGVRRHAMAHYLAACADGLDLSGLVTHVEALEGHYDLCAALADPARSRVVKAAFAPNGP